MSGFRLDKEKVLSQHTYAAYNTQYWLYDRDKITPSVSLKDELRKTETQAVENKNKSCFGDMSSNLMTYITTNKKEPNRLMFIVHPKQHTKVRLKSKEIERWVKECKSHKLMPMSIGPLFLKTMYFILKPANLNMQQIYLYLMSARYIQEEPFFVKTLFYLLDEGLDFWISMCVACTTTGANAGHGYLPVSKSYGHNTRTYDPNNERFDLNTARQFRRFVLEGGIEKVSKTIKESSEDYLKKSPSFRSFSFNFQTSMVHYTPPIPNLKEITVEKLKDPEIVKLVNS